MVGCVQCWIRSACTAGMVTCFLIELHVRKCFQSFLVSFVESAGCIQILRARQQEDVLPRKEFRFVGHCSAFC